MDIPTLHEQSQRLTPYTPNDVLTDIAERTLTLALDAYYKRESAWADGDEAATRVLELDLRLARDTLHSIVNHCQGHWGDRDSLYNVSNDVHAAIAQHTPEA